MRVLPGMCLLKDTLVCKVGLIVGLTMFVCTDEIVVDR